MASRTTKLICPECGGVLGHAEPGESPCTCFRDEDRPTNSDTQLVELSGAPKGKICISCGKDLTGKKRYKDSRGYMCAECTKAEEDGKKVGTVPCAECNRRVKPEGLMLYGGMRICKRCYEDHKQTSKKKYRKVSTRAFESHERRNLLILLLICLALAGLMLYSYLN